MKKLTVGRPESHQTIQECENSMWNNNMEIWEKMSRALSEFAERGVAPPVGAGRILTEKWILNFKCYKIKSPFHPFGKKAKRYATDSSSEKNVVLGGRTTVGDGVMNNLSAHNTQVSIII